MTANCTWCESPGDQTALRLMVRIVQVDHGLVRGLVEVRTRPTEGGEPNTVTLDRHDVVVARDGPELLNRIPVHRRLFTQPPVSRPWIDIERRIEHVDARHRRGLGRHRYDTA